MSEDRKGYCGICAESGSMKPEDFQDKGEMQSCWVECYACKGQYVVENVAALNVGSSSFSRAPISLIDRFSVGKGSPEVLVLSKFSNESLSAMRQMLEQNHHSQASSNDRI
jgi:hypothetical protein